MSGWTGGSVNRRWQRGRRGPDHGGLHLQEDIARILAEFRAANGWEPGSVWDPYSGSYVIRKEGS